LRRLRSRRPGPRRACTGSSTCAIVWFVYSLWRRRREEISAWSVRARAVFYVAAGTALANLLASFALTYPETGLERLVFFAVFGLAGFAMWRVWRDEHTYGY